MKEFLTRKWLLSIIFAVMLFIGGFSFSNDALAYVSWSNPMQGSTQFINTSVFYSWSSNRSSFHIRFWHSNTQNWSNWISTGSAKYRYYTAATPGYVYAQVAAWVSGSNYEYSDNRLVYYVNPPPTVDIKANNSDGPITINYNTSATLSWTSANATSCSVSPGGWTGTSNTSGKSTGNLISSTTYTLSCAGPGGTATNAVTINVNPPPTLSCSPSSQSALTGQSVSFTASGGTGTYSWSTDNGDGGSPTTGSGASFSTAYSLAGFKTVNVISGTQIKTCNTTVATPTVSVSGFTASPSSGIAPLNGVDLSVTISSNVSATSYLYFYCNRVDTGTNITTPYNHSVSLASGILTFNAADVCNYSSAGTYYPKVIVTRGSASPVQTQTQINVAQAFNYSLSNGGSRSVTQGYSTSNLITVTKSAGTAQAVTLSASQVMSPLPAGVTASFSPASCSPNTTCTSTLTLLASSGAAPGNYTIMVTGNPLSKTTTFSFAISEATLGVALTATPSSGMDSIYSVLSANVSGSAVGTMNYSFWFNCSDPGTSVSLVQSVCGVLPVPSNPGVCAVNNVGEKCNGVISTSQSLIGHTYATGLYTPKVIVERGSAPSAQARANVNVVATAFDYSLSAGSGASSVTKGNSVQRTITVSKLAGTAQNVSLSAGGSLPYGVTASFSPALCLPNNVCSSVLTLSASGIASAGTYTINVTGSLLNKSVSFQLSIIDQTLSVGLAASPNSGNSPVNSFLTANISGTAPGTINYNFWWNCSNTTTSVSTASRSDVCGPLPAPSFGQCASNSNGYKCNGVSEISKSVSHSYVCDSVSCGYSGKVIVERGFASPAQALAPITVSVPAVTVSCSNNGYETPLANKAALNEPITWTATASGGTGSYSYVWGGTVPLNGKTGASATVSYNSEGTKTGSVTATSGGRTATANCSKSVIVAKSSVAISPATKKIKEGFTTQLQALYCKYRAGDCIDITNSTLNWRTNSEAASVNNTNHKGLVTGNSQGIASIDISYTDAYGNYFSTGVSPYTGRASIIVETDPIVFTPNPPTGVLTNQNINFNIQSGGIVGNYSWSAPGGSPSSGSGSSFTTKYTSAGTKTVTVISGSQTESVSFAVTAEALSMTNLQVSPSTGIAPLNTTFYVRTTTNIPGTANYSFWWNCGYTGTSVSAAQVQCGSLPAPVAGKCVSNSVGAKCDGFASPDVSLDHTYASAGNFTAKAIVERGSQSLESRASLSVTSGALSLNLFDVSPATGKSPVNTAFSVKTTSDIPGTANYSFWWNCSYTGANVSIAKGQCGNLPDPVAGSCANNSAGAKCDGISAREVSLNHTYSSAGNFTAKAIVERGSLSVESRKSLSYVVVDIKAQAEDGPVTVNPGETTILAWTSSNANSCSASGDWSGSKPVSKVAESSPPINQPRDYTFTLTCVNSATGASANDSVIVRTSAFLRIDVLDAILNSGTRPWDPHYGVDLRPDITTNITGVTSNYTYYCNRSDSGTNITGGWDRKNDNVDPAGDYNIVFDACNYINPGAYTPKVIVERGGLAAEKRTSVVVEEVPPNQAPSVTPLAPEAPSDYTASPFGWTLRWTFSDPQGDSQSAYRIVITDVSNGSVVKDTSEITSSSNSYSIPVGTLDFNKTYSWTIKVWDNHPNRLTAQVGGANFTTIKHAAPSLSVTLAPSRVSMDEILTITDTSTTYGGSTKVAWEWDFTEVTGYTLLTPANQSSVQVKFSTTGAKNIKLKVTDSDGLWSRRGLNDLPSDSLPNISVGRRSPTNFQEIVP